MTVLTTDSSPGASRFMPSVVRPCSCTFFTALENGTLEEGPWCRFRHVLLHAFASLAVKRCCLDSKINGAGVSPESLINAPRGIVGSAPRIDLARRLTRSWGSSHLLALLGSHLSSLSYSATAWTHATWTALTLSGTTPYVFVRVWSLAFAASGLFMHQWWCSLSVRCASIQTPSQHVAWLLNRMNPSLTLIFAVSFDRRCLLWPRLRVNSAASVFAVSNCSARLLAYSMLFAAHRSSIVTTWLTSFPVATQPRSSTEDRPSASDMYSSTHLISPEV